MAIVAVLLASCGTNSEGPASPAGTASPGPTLRGAPTAGAAPTAAGPTASGPTTSGPASPNHSAASPTGSASSPGAPPATCSALAGRLTLREQVGQLFMVGVPTSGLTSSTARALSATRAGSVILLGNTTAGTKGVGRLVGDVRDATRRPAGVRTLLAADQEGGLVQRLKGDGFADMPSARTQGTWSAQRLRTSAQDWGRELRRAGIDANLAPVADVVPSRLLGVNQPIGVLRRGFSSDPAVVATHTAAFVDGMDGAGVATAVKHFPGLGAVRGNTDLVTRVVDRSTGRHDSDLAGFRSAAKAGVDMVMVSSAYYTKIDPDTRAAYSPVVIAGMIRGDLGFAGVVVSDDLAAPGVRDVRPGARATRFLGAGGDLVIVGDPARLSAMVDAVRDKAAADGDFRKRVAESARRVLAMKAARGLAHC